MMRALPCFITALLLLALALPAQADEPVASTAEAANDTMTAEPEATMLDLGLPVGALAPDFVATTPDGQGVTLFGDLLADQKWTVLVTYRGGWCPFCNRQLHALTEITDEIAERDAKIVAISVDLPDKATATVAEQELPFMVLSDPSAQMFKDYNIVNRIPDETYDKYVNDYKFDIEEWSGEDHHIVTHPAVIILDPHGFIRYFHVNPDYKVRLTNEEVLAALDSVQRPLDKQPVM